MFAVCIQQMKSLIGLMFPLLIGFPFINMSYIYVPGHTAIYNKVIPERMGDLDSILPLQQHGILSSGSEK